MANESETASESGCVPQGRMDTHHERKLRARRQLATVPYLCFPLRDSNDRLLGRVDAVRVQEGWPSVPIPGRRAPPHTQENCNWRPIRVTHDIMHDTNGAVAEAELDAEVVRDHDARADAEGYSNSKQMFGHFGGCISGISTQGLSYLLVSAHHTQLEGSGEVEFIDWGWACRGSRCERRCVARTTGTSGERIRQCENKIFTAHLQLPQTCPNLPLAV